MAKCSVAFLDFYPRATRLCCLKKMTRSWRLMVCIFKLCYSACFKPNKTLFDYIMQWTISAQIGNDSREEVFRSEAWNSLTGKLRLSENLNPALHIIYWCWIDLRHQGFCDENMSQWNRMHNFKRRQCFLTFCKAWALVKVYSSYRHLSPRKVAVLNWTQDHVL